MEAENVKKLQKTRSKTEIIPKRVQDASQGGLGEVLGRSWGGLGGVWEGSEGVPGPREVQKGAAYST